VSYAQHAGRNPCGLQAVSFIVVGLYAKLECVNIFQGNYPTSNVIKIDTAAVK
jgi:hypothetical protein